MNGIIVLNKEQSFTSFDVVAVMRKISGQKKIGHCGTLDPNATGVLPLLLGNATKAQDIIPDHDKEYVAEFRLGATSDTLDIWGNVTEKEKPDISLDTLSEALEKFKGNIRQIPPMYSAIQINGQRLYDLARKGIEVERKSREVTVYSLELFDFNTQTQEGRIRVFCSKGTYIRTLIDDIGKALGCGAVMTSLERTKACGYTLENAVTLDKAKQMAENGALQSVLLPVESLFEQYGSVTVTQPQARRFKNGGQLDISRTSLANGCEDKEIYRVKDKEGAFLGLGITDLDDGLLKIYKMF